mmetsp:Transcript_3167/g.3899  ORF Transcript_3167/g.3899 Transcript_3167/m.3899 type:complete len:156 (+) Transcript_3167:10-477(+)
MTTIGPYEVLETIGEGSYGKVVLAKHFETGHELAVKYMRIDYCTESTLEEFNHEVGIMKRLSHQNLVKLVDSCAEATLVESEKKQYKVCYFSMELANEGTLFQYIEKTGRFEEPFARYIFRQLIQAVEAMHEAGISHCDIKPENILLNKEHELKL